MRRRKEVGRRAKSEREGETQGRKEEESERARDGDLSAIQTSVGPH